MQMRAISIGIRDIQNAKKSITESSTRLSSGSRVKQIGADQVALTLSSKQESDSLSLEKAGSNIQEGISLAHTIEGSVSEIMNVLIKTRELAIRSANDTYDDTQRKQTNLEFEQLLEEVDKIAIRSTYNNQQLMDGSISSISVQVGKDNNSDNRISIDLSFYASRLSNINVGGGDSLSDVKNAGIATQATALDALQKIDTALDVYTEMRSTLGATLNRFDSSLNNLVEEKVSTDISAARISDVDMAKESSEMARSKLLLESSTAALKQVSSIHMTNVSLISQ
jgi:flagellin